MRTVKGGWTQDYFTPKHPEKCINSQAGERPYYRSSWEAKFFNWADLNKNVKKWGSEIVKIPYIYDIDKSQSISRVRNYYPDIYLEMINKKGQLRKYLIEIKPIKQKERPVMPKRKTKKAMQNYLIASATWIKNQNKWKYANMYCEGKNWEFKVITESDIFDGD